MDNVAIAGIVGIVLALPAGIVLGEIGARIALAVKRWRVQRYLGIDADTLALVGVAVEAINAGPTDAEIEAEAFALFYADFAKAMDESIRRHENRVPGLLAGPAERIAYLIRTHEPSTEGGAA